MMITNLATSQKFVIFLIFFLGKNGFLIVMVVWTFGNLMCDGGRASDFLDFDFVVLCGFGPWKFCDDGGVLDLVMMVVGFWTFFHFILYYNRNYCIILFLKRCMVGEIDPSSLVVGDFVFVGSSLGLLLYPTQLILCSSSLPGNFFWFDSTFKRKKIFLLPNS